MQNHRYSIVPILTTILKVAAVLTLLYFLYQSIDNIARVAASWKGGVTSYGAIEKPLPGFFPRLGTLIPPIFNIVIGALFASLAWGFGELFSMIREMLLAKTAEPAVVKET